MEDIGGGWEVSKSKSQAEQREGMEQGQNLPLRRLVADLVTAQGMSWLGFVCQICI